jgi:hypothetical protein
MIHLFILLALSVAADDKKDTGIASPGTEYEGTYKAVEITTTSTGKKNTKRVHADLKIVVAERKGDKFKGEFWLDNGKKGYAIEGTVDAAGNIAFKFTKKLKGTWPSDMIDNAVVKGVIQKNQLMAKFLKQGNEIITGDIAAKKTE